MEMWNTKLGPPPPLTPKNGGVASPVASPVSQDGTPIMATLRASVESEDGVEIAPKKCISFDWTIHGNGDEEDFVGLYRDSPECYSLDKYESSLMTEAKSQGVATFTSPPEEGKYFVRLVRNDEVELAAAPFRVVIRAEGVPAAEAEAAAAGEVALSQTLLEKRGSNTPESVLGFPLAS